MGKTNIQWTDMSWNVARGCTKVDEDCKFCYMYRDSFNSKRYDPLQVVRTKTVFNLPLKLKEPSKVFTSSLTDVFHPAIDSYRNEMWDIIRKCPQHTFQILTKRPERIKVHLPDDWCEGWDNVWLGTSAGSQNAQSRIIDLMQVKAKTRFLSLEPLWGPIDLKNLVHQICSEDSEIKPLLGCTQTLDVIRGELVQGRVGFDAPKIDWVIVGGESGNENGKYRYRPCELKWIEKIVSDCKYGNIPVFVKQLGTHLSKQLKLSDRHGGKIEEFPDHLQVREFPKK